MKYIAMHISHFTEVFSGRRRESTVVKTCDVLMPIHYLAFAIHALGNVAKLQ